MNNVKRDENFYSSKGIAEPRIILNADVDTTQSLVARSGTKKVVSLPGAHSLWADISCMMCVAAGSLYRIHQGNALKIAAINDRDFPVYFLEIDGRVYFSNRYCQGSFNPVTNTVSDWGLLPPPGPVLIAGVGSLPPGVYSVTMTAFVDDEISGAGPISKIELLSEGGIQIINRPSGSVVWCTDANADIFYRVGAVNSIVASQSVEPCPSILFGPPPFLENLCYAFGRIWGSSGPDLFYSLPYNRKNLFSLTTHKFSYPAEISIIAKVPTGLFIGMKGYKTIFLSGTEPDQMRETDAGAGSIPGTLAYCNNVPELGDILGTPEKGYVDVPVWVTEEGIVIGNAAGKLYNLTKNKIMFGVPDKGASLYRNNNGVFQFLTSFKKGDSGSGVGFSDDATCEVFRNGKLVTI